MAIIEVNHNELNKTSEKIDKYIGKVKTNMKKIEEEVTNLSSSWSGEDYVQFKKEAAEKNAKGSATDAMLTSLASYSKALKNISSQYKKAQIKAINRANYLCK